MTGTRRTTTATGTTGVEDPREAMAGHLRSLRAFAMTLARDEAAADDLVQDAIVKAWTNLDKFEPGTNLKGWLFTILRNTFYSDRRRSRREVQDTDGLHAAKLVEKPAHDGRLAFGEFMCAFRKLSPEHREVLVLVGAEGFSYEEAAEMMGVAKGTAKSRASRARGRLAELLGLKEGEDLVAKADGGVLAVLTGVGVKAA